MFDLAQSGVYKEIPNLTTLEKEIIKMYLNIKPNIEY